VAKEKGLWRQHRVDVDVVGFSGGDSVQAFVAGKVDFGLMMAGTAVGLQASGQADLVVLAEIDWSHGGDKIVVKRGTKLAALKGKRIGIYEDSPAVMMFLAAKLKAEGLDFRDFQIVVIEDMESLASQFVAGRLACAVSYEPYVEQATKGGDCEVVASTADFPGVMPEVLVVQRSRLARMPPEHVVGVLAGWVDAVEWVQQQKNRGEFARICIEHAFREQRVTPEQITDMLANVRIHGVEELRARNLQPDGIAKFLAECATFAKLVGATKGIDVQKLLEVGPLQRVLAARAPAQAAPPK
jgi:NitT/TauT family transport system substrate-binding protein